MILHEFLPRFLMTLLVCSALAGCGGGSGSSSFSALPDLEPQAHRFDDLRPYSTSSAYADVMTSCVKVEETRNSCALSILPLTGMETEAPSTTDIMDRVLVSHDWMGERFEQALNILPADIRLLLRATTAIVIDDDIRPAFYTTLTGAIYLDPAYLWVTPAELATINPQEDYRAGFSDPLQFRSLGRYVQNGTHVYPLGLLQDNPNKTINDVALLIGQLLYHELAHANDFLPPDSWDHLSSNDSVYQAIVNNADNFVATRLDTMAPLTSGVLASLAQVMYHGKTPSATDLSITATEVGEAFETDSANEHYAYSSIFEDSAMLFEEAMMKYHFDIDRDIAFTAAPPDPALCDGYTVGWGVRNRLGDTDVKARAQFVAGELLPSLELSMFFQEFPLPQPMTRGVNWCDSINMNAPLNYELQKTTVRTLPPRDLREPH